MEENGMMFDSMVLRNLCQAIWEDSGVGESTTMGFEDFKKQLLRHDGLAEGLAKRFADVNRIFMGKGPSKRGILNILNIISLFKFRMILSQKKKFSSYFFSTKFGV